MFRGKTVQGVIQEAPPGTIQRCVHKVSFLKATEADIREFWKERLGWIDTQTYGDHYYSWTTAYYSDRMENRNHISFHFELERDAVLFKLFHG